MAIFLIFAALSITAIGKKNISLHFKTFLMQNKIHEVTQNTLLIATV